MGKSLSPHTPEELVSLRAKVGHRREYLKLLEFELANTRGALLEFTELYNQRVGPLEAEYNRLELLMDEAIAFEEARTDSTGNHNGRHESAKANRRGGKKGGGQPNKEAKPKDPEFEQKIRELFRNLAKRFHPDLVDDPKEKRAREKIMSRINQAYAARDLSALQELAEHIQNRPSDSRDPNVELAQLKIELRQLEAMIFEVEHTIRELDLSPAMQLRSDFNSEAQAGRDLLADIEASLKVRIAELREHLLDLGIEPEEMNA